MGSAESGWGRWVLTVVVSIVLPAAGCMELGNPPGGSDSGLFAALGLDDAVLSTEDDENDSFNDASPRELAEGRPTAISGSIDPANDVDVYEFGAADAGDRLVVEVVGNEGLNAVAAVFDADFNLIYLNDDRDYFARQVDPQIDFVLRRATGRFYVATASSPGTNTRGAYKLAASLTSNNSYPKPEPQVVLLNFDGASAVAFAGRSPVEIPEFDGATISGTLAGMTDTLLALVLERVREDFVGLDVEIYSSDELLDPGADVTAIHFGAYDPGLLGVAENVDEFNERTVQEAIVFTDTFEVFGVLDPTIEEYAQALANVASHEIGHLLGLVHTADSTGLMDITASLRQLMRNQAFSRSPLEGFTMPIGFQDAVVTLIDSVGGDAELLRTQAVEQLRNAKTLPAADAGELDGVDRSGLILSTCMTRGHQAGRMKRIRSLATRHPQ